MSRGLLALGLALALLFGLGLAALLGSSPARPAPSASSEAVEALPSGARRAQPRAGGPERAGPRARAREGALDPGETAKALGSPAPNLSASELGGTVSDEQGAPLLDVPVVLVHGPAGPLSGPATRSAAGGVFRLDAPPGAGPSVLKVGGRARPALHVQVWPGSPLALRLLPGSVLRGRLVGADGRPLAGRVHGRCGDWGESVVADAAGSFRFESAPPGLIDLAARPAPESGALEARGEVVVQTGRSREVELRCAPGQTLRGRVLGAIPAGGARLVIWSAEGSAADARTTRSAPDGSFELRGLEPGELWLTAHGAGTSAGPASIMVPLGADPEPVELSLGADQALRGRVLAASDAGERPAGGVQLVLTGPSVTLNARSDSEGSFAFPPAPVGEYRIQALHPGYVALDEALRFAPGDPPLWVELTPAARLSGRVLTPSGQPLAGARVEARWSRELATLSDASGAYSLGGLPPGPIQIRVAARGYGAGADELLLQAGEVVARDLIVVDPAQVSGRVLDGAGAPLVGAVVRLTGPADEALAQSDPAGEFRLEGLGLGPYRLQATRPGYAVAERDYVGPGERVELYLEATLPVTGVVRTLSGDPVHAVLVAPADQPERAQLFEGSRFALVVGSETRQLLVRARSGPAHHGHGPGFLSPVYVQIPPGGGALTIDLAPGGEAQGQVFGPRGEPIPGAAFLAGRQREELLDGEAGQSFLLGLSEDEGRFELHGIPTEGLEATISHPDYAPRVVQLRPGEGQRLTLAPGAELSGLTLGREGQPQAGVPVIVDGPTLRRLTSDAEGRYRAAGLAPGRYRLIRYDTEVERELELSSGQRATLDLP